MMKFIGPFVFGVFIGTVLMGSIMKYKYASEAIERGYALYCLESGDWAWRGECDALKEGEK